MVLTFHTVVVACCRVFLLPARQADLLPAAPAGVVPEVVVPRLAQDVTVGAVVLVRADQPEVVLELVLPVLAVDPRLAGLEALGLYDPVEEGGVGAWNMENAVNKCVGRRRGGTIALHYCLAGEAGEVVL